MKFVDEYRRRGDAQKLAAAIRDAASRPHTIMEVCGGQTHAIVKFGIDQFVDGAVSYIHGPGCPVCVTPVELIDKAVALTERPGVTLCSFGDMLRVPGTRGDLFHAKARGGDVRVVYSPLDAVRLAQRQPDREFVFFAVGFETTAPANALAVFQAHQQGVENFSILCSHVLVPPAMESILASPDCRVDAFLAAGHVCTITGYRAYHAIAERYGVPIVVTGFEPLDLLHGTYLCVRQLEEGRAEVENQYTRSVRQDGNVEAQRLLETVFEVVSRQWRGVGRIDASGLGLRGTFQNYDAERRFDLSGTSTPESSECISGDILRGTKRPHECPAFGTRCTPDQPLGAPMVSNEGACAAYYRYRGVEPANAGGANR